MKNEYEVHNEKETSEARSVGVRNKECDFQSRIEN